MPKFLNADEVYRVLQRELPDEVYPDGAPSDFYSTASIFSKAATIATAYNNLERIYQNFFPQDADEQIANWEEKVFGFQLDSALSLADRRAAVIAKIRLQRSTRPLDMKNIVYEVIPNSVQVEIVEWNCGGGGWVLDVSELDIMTYLNAFNGLTPIGAQDLCGLTAVDYWLSQEDFTDYQNQAYTFDVRIYNYTLTALERETIEAKLLVGEPARSRHFIIDGLDYATEALGGDL